MKEYILKDKIIIATQKAYELLYKEKGYLSKETKPNKPVKEPKESE